MAKGRKTGGRKKGTPNKNCVYLVDKLEEINFDIVSAIIESMADVTPSMRVDPLIKMLEFVYPKKRAETVSVSGVIGTAEVNKKLTEEDLLALVEASRTKPPVSMD